MRRNPGVSLLASILACCLIMAVVLVALGQADGAGSLPRAAAAAALQQDDEEQDGREQDDDGGGGPPAWASAHGKDKGHGASSAKAGKAAGKAAWKKAWRELTPAEKDMKMADLVKAHEEGMRTWTDCVAAAGDDATERGECTKPLPPGLAKKLP